MQSFIELDDVGYKTKQREILQHVDLSIEPNQIITVIGPNGAGKTSLLKIIAGLIKPSSGNVKRRNKLRLSYLPQNFSLPLSMPVTVSDFLGTSLKTSGLSKCEAIKMTSLEVSLSQSVHDVSGGELQKLLLARALLTKPELLILDEPAQGYDQVMQAAFYQTLQELRESMQCSILLVSHDLQLVMSATDHVVCLNTHICCEGQPGDISQSSEYLALFGDTRLSSQFAVYQHEHDHEHGADGKIIHNHDHE